MSYSIEGQANYNGNQVFNALKQGAFLNYKVNRLLNFYEKHKDDKGFELSQKENVLTATIPGKKGHKAREIKVNLDVITKSSKQHSLSRFTHRLTGTFSKGKYDARLKTLIAALASPEIPSDTKTPKKTSSGSEQNDDTPLQTAMFDGNVAMVTELINAGADVNRVDRDGFTPLYSAVLNGNVPIATLLINAGADVNCVDHEGVSPLHSAVLDGNIAMVKELVNAGADVNSVDHEDFSPLRSAVLNGNVAIVTELINAGADVNRVDNKGFTPLYSAILDENVPIAKELINAGADVNQLVLDGSPLIFLAVTAEDIEMFQALIEGGANLHAVDEIGHSLLDSIKISRPPNYRELVDLIKEAPLVKDLSKQNRYRLGISHAWHISGTSSLIKTDSKEVVSQLNLEGASSSLWFHEMGKNFNAFMKAYPELELPSHLKEAMIFASLGKSQSNEDILKRIEDGLPTFIQSGYVGNQPHATTLFIWGDQLVICDRGGASRKPLDIYHFQGKFTLELIEKIRNGDLTNYDELIYRDLPLTLDLSRTPLDKRLQNAAALPFQKVGNCSWVSPITAILSMILIGGVRGEEDGQLLDLALKQKLLIEKVDKQVEVYRAWLGFQQISSLEKMMKLLKPGQSSFDPDHPLIQNALHQAYSLALDATLSEKLNALTDFYISTLESADHDKFKKNLTSWKKVPNSKRNEIPL